MNLNGRRAVFARKGALLAGIAIVGLALVSLVILVSLQRSGAYVWPMGPWPASDKEWMAAIEKAKRNMNDPEAPWPEPWTPPWVRVVRSCSEVPFGRLERALRVEYSPGNARRRVTVDHGELRLILYSDQDLSGCPEQVMELLEREPVGYLPPWRRSAAEYICDGMVNITQGKPPAFGALDPAWRPLPSPEVAQAYREAFCQPAPAPSPTLAAPPPAGPPPTPTEGPRYSPTMAAAQTAAAAEAARPRFFGELGDFEVKRPYEIPNRLPPCPSGYAFEPAESPAVQRSEIYFSLPGFKSHFETLCEGRVTSVAAEGPEGNVRRGYYSGPGKVQVPFEVPRDRIQLLTVGGRPAIAQLPHQGELKPHVSVWVIQRHPTPSTPGIGLGVNTERGLNVAVALLEQILAQGPR